MKNDLISVIVPVYNVEQYLGKCLRSIMDQTYKNIEIILVDDGSTDSSGFICEKAAIEDKRCLVFHKKNGGLSSARNFGIKYAKGRYLSFVDSDDYLMPTMIEKMHCEMIKHSVEIVACNYLFYFDESDKKRVHPVWTDNSVELSSNMAKKLLLFENTYRCYAWNKMYSKYLFDDIEFPEGKLYEDIITSYKLISKIDKMYFVNEALYVYRQRVGSITQKSNKRVYEILDPIRIILGMDSNSYVRMGSLLYYKYFFHDVIKQHMWDKDVYLEAKKIYSSLKKDIHYCPLLPIRIKVEFIILFSSEIIYSWLLRFYFIIRDKSYRKMEK